MPSRSPLSGEEGTMLLAEHSEDTGHAWRGAASAVPC